MAPATESLVLGGRGGPGRRPGAATAFLLGVVMSEERRERLQTVATAIVLMLLLAAAAMAQGEPGRGVARLADVCGGAQ